MIDMIWYKYEWVCFKMRMSSQKSSDIIRRWDLIERWKMNKEDTLKGDKKW